jgi:hypothetical protein
MSRSLRASGKRGALFGGVAPSSSGLCVAGVALLGAAACPAPSDMTPLIHVDPRAASRFAAIMGPSRTAATTPPANASRVHVMREGEQLGGPNAIGRPGDLVLENNEVVFVIDQLGSSAGFAETGGNLVDAADARARKDELGQLFSYFGTFPRQGVYDSVESGVDPDGSAWVQSKGHELYEGKLAVTTRYTLHPPDRALFIETRIANTGDAPIDIPSVGDAVQWGGAEKVAPGKPPGFKGPSSGAFVGGVGRFTSYAITSTDGTIDGISGSSWTDTAQRKAVHLAPGEKADYARIFLVGERPDSASLISELALAAAQPVGDVRITAPSVPAGALITLYTDGATSSPITLAYPFAGRLPVGTYWVAVGTYWVAAPGTKAGPLVVKAGEEATLALPGGSAPGSLEARCLGSDQQPAGEGPRQATGPVPCKLTIEGIAPSSNPDFGPAHAAGPAHNQSTSADGVTKVALVPGKYHLTASRGPEYALATSDVEVAPGAEAHATLKLVRVVDTRGYLACDFHQHTMLGTDAPVAKRDRVISNAAEGVEVAVASEHNVIADLEPLVKELGLEREMVSIPGDELTSDASRHPWGHANAWPLVPDPTKPRGNAPVVRDRTAHDVFEELRRAANAAGADLVIQVNHPRSGNTGYFDQLAFDPARGVGSDPGYDAAFDALEVWNGRNVGPRSRVIDDWRAILRTGHPVTATADTDTHGIVGQEAGYPRTYVRVADDEHLGAWDAARTAEVVRGVKVLRDVVLTNGPMLRVSANGAPIGGVARGGHGGEVTVKVHVECAPWVEVDTLRLVRVSEGELEKGEDSRRVKLAPLKDGAVGADVVLRAHLSADDAVFVVASGSKPMHPVLGGDDREIAPWAMTGAIWVDADGDGQTLGRKQAQK